MFRSQSWSFAAVQSSNAFLWSVHAFEDVFVPSVGRYLILFTLRLVILARHFMISIFGHQLLDSEIGINTAQLGGCGYQRATECVLRRAACAKFGYVSSGLVLCRFGPMQACDGFDNFMISSMVFVWPQSCCSSTMSFVLGEM